MRARARCVCRSRVNGKWYRTWIRTDVRACVREKCTTLGVKNGCKRIVAESTSRVEELAEFRWTRPDAASRPRRGRGWNIVHTDVHVARNVGENAERLLLRIMSIHFVRQRMRNYESNLEEILFFCSSYLPLNVLPCNFVSKGFCIFSRVMEIFNVLLTGGRVYSAYRLGRCGWQVARSYHWLMHQYYFSDDSRSRTAGQISISAIPSGWLVVCLRYYQIELLSVPVSRWLLS